MRIVAWGCDVQSSLFWERNGDHVDRYPTLGLQWTDADRYFICANDGGTCMAGLDEKHDRWIYDLSDRPALIIQMPRESSEGELARFEEELHVLAAEAQGQDVGDSSNAPAQVGRYQIGPAAEWTYTFAIAWDAVQQAPDLFAQAVDWAMRFEFLFGRLNSTSPDSLPDAASNGSSPPSTRPTELTVTPPVVVSLVLSHFQATYGALDSLKLSWFVRGPRYGSGLSQPSGNELYTIDVHDDSSHYVYVVTGSAVPMEHFLLSCGRLHPLEEPQWLGREPSDTFEILESAFRHL